MIDDSYLNNVTKNLIFCSFSSVCLEKCFTQIDRVLYVDIHIEIPQRGTNMAAVSKQKHLLLDFAIETKSLQTDTLN